MITTIVRFSYLNVFEPIQTNKSEPTATPIFKYSSAILIPNPKKISLEDIKAAINKAINVNSTTVVTEFTQDLNEICNSIVTAIIKGVRANKYTLPQVKSPTFKIALRDGTVENESGDRGSEYKDHFFLNASNSSKPGIVNAQGKPIFDPADLYSGSYGHADITFFPFSKQGNRGVGVGLNNIMKVKDGDRLDGRQSANDAFASHVGLYTETEPEAIDTELE